MSDQDERDSRGMHIDGGAGVEGSSGEPHASDAFDSGVHGPSEGMDIGELPSSAPFGSTAPLLSEIGETPAQARISLSSEAERAPLDFGMTLGSRGLQTSEAERGDYTPPSYEGLLRNGHVPASVVERSYSGGTAPSSQTEMFGPAAGVRRARGELHLPSESEGGFTAQSLRRPTRLAVPGVTSDVGGDGLSVASTGRLPGMRLAGPTSSELQTGTEAALAQAVHGNAEGRTDGRLRVIWGTNIAIQDALDSFRSFVTSFTPNHRAMHEARLRGDGEVPQTTALDLEPLYPRLLRQIRDTEVHNLNVDVANMRAYGPTVQLAMQLQHYPTEIMSLMDLIVNEVFAEAYPDVDVAAAPIQVRPFNVGATVNMRTLDPGDIDKLVAIRGLVIRTSAVIPDMRVAYFACSACGNPVTVESVRGRIQEPARCPRDGCGAARSMALVHNRCVFSDKQVVKVQETPDSIPDGQTPHSVSVCVYDALVDVARPGDRVEITGIFRTAPVRVAPHQRRLKALFRTYIDVAHLKRTEKSRVSIASGTDGAGSTEAELLVAWDESDIVRAPTADDTEDLRQIVASPGSYERLSSAIAPSVFGLPDVKKGLLLQLMGGVAKTLRRGTASRFRGDINILLAGDPGVSKSQLLQYVHKLAPRGIYTSGKGSSAVGLTAYITRDAESKQLVLESGALVLSDGGVCCIDEFDKMSDETRAILHEVMEQQTVSIAKAGIITTLNARTSILASANPVESKYNASRSIVENLNLPPTILSRFDIIYIVLDTCTPEDDQRLGRHIVGLYTATGAGRSRTALAERPIDVNTLVRYIGHARSLRPVITPPAEAALANAYVAMRRVNGSSGKTVSATTRQLESLIRLSEAHARARLSSSVEESDVAEAVRLIREAMLSFAVDPLTGRIDMDLVTTGKSAAVRERQAELKREVKNILGSRDARAMDYASLAAQLAAQSSITINDKWLRDVVQELADEEFITVSGSLARGQASLQRIA